MQSAPETPLAPRQRWRMTFARDADPARRAHRDIAEEWSAALLASGLPIARPQGRARSPITFAAPLPAGMECRAELADFTLAALSPVWSVRDRLMASLPSGITLLGLDDVWLGAPALPAAVRAGDYRVAIRADDAATAAKAARDFLGRRSIERERQRGGGIVRYDIRPLVEDIQVAPAEPAVLRIRTTFDPERGAGRPDEVLMVLGDLAGQPFETGAMVRERLILAG